MQQPRTRDGRYTFKPGAGDVPEASLGAPGGQIEVLADALEVYRQLRDSTDPVDIARWRAALAEAGINPDASQVDIARAAGGIVLSEAERSSGIDADELADGRKQLTENLVQLKTEIISCKDSLSDEERRTVARFLRDDGGPAIAPDFSSEELKRVAEMVNEWKSIREVVLDRTPYLELAEHYKATLAKIRPMGGEHEYHPKASAEARRAFDEAMACYPSEWIAKSSDHERKLLPKVSKTRAHYAHLRSVRKKAAKVFLAPENRRPAYAYTPYQKELSQEEIDAHPANIRSREGYMPVVMYDVEFGEQKPSGWGWQRWDDPKGLYSQTAWQRPKAGLFNDKNEKASEITTNHFGDGTYATCVHEMAHRMEATVGAGIVDAERSFLASRSQGEEKVTLFGGSLHRGRPEIAYKTDLKDAYMGKIYDDDSFEIMSCGMEGLFGGSYDGLGGDRDMREFILGVLATE